MQQQLETSYEAAANSPTRALLPGLYSLRTRPAAWGSPPARKDSKEHNNTAQLLALLLPASSARSG